MSKKQIMGIDFLDNTKAYPLSSLGISPIFVPTDLTAKELNESNPDIYEYFLYCKMKFGMTFKQFRKEILK